MSLRTVWNTLSRSSFANRRPRFLYFRSHSTVSNYTMASDGSQTTSDRLGNDVIPKHYDLVVKTDLEQLTFSGNVSINLDIQKPVSSIVLHADPGLEISKALLSSSALKTSSLQAPTKISRDDDLQRAILEFPSQLPGQTEAKLRLAFNGKLTGSMMGYYKSSYVTSEGKDSHFALTQFEPTAARNAFPCFDEPALKATFDMALLSRKDTVSLANTQVVSTKPSSSEVVELEKFAENEQEKFTVSEKKGPNSAPDDEWILTQYATTPKMSTYLVAYANGNFEHIESSYVSPLTNETIPLRVYATKECIHQAQLSLDVTAKILPIYERIFNIPYPLKKLDTLVATDFEAGAMENWGLITGRTAIYLYDPKKSGIVAQKRTTSVQSHEVAHQWFGNIVTMEFWDGLWLNEAFATLMGEVIIPHEIHPEWKVHSQFISTHYSSATRLDALRSSHPIEMPCPDSRMVNQIFDAVSYSKGASVLRQLSNLVGQDTFLKGVSIYLKKHLYGNTKTNDLWDGISEASGLDVAKIMNNWTRKVGFPVLTVQETPEGLKIRQNRFLSTGDVKPEDDETLWYIPLTIRKVDANGNETVERHSFETRETTVPLPNANTINYKINAETAGLYRTLYPSERWAKLGDEAGKKDSAFTQNDRIGLVQDANVLAQSGYIKTSSALDFVSKMKNETEYLVWTEIAAGLSRIASVFWEQDDKIRDSLNAFRRELFGPISDSVGFNVSEEESSEKRELRITLLSVAAAAEYKPVVDEIKKRFGALMDNNDDSLIPNDLLRIIYSFAVKYGGEKEYNKVLDIYRNPPTPQHKMHALSALSATRDPALIQKSFDMILSGEIKDQDFMYPLAGLAENPAARRQCWEYFKKNYDVFIEKFDGKMMIGRLVKYTFENFTSKSDLADVEQFFKDKKTKGYDQALAQGTDSVKGNISWLERDLDDIKTWLSDKKY